MLQGREWRGAWQELRLGARNSRLLGFHDATVYLLGPSHLVHVPALPRKIWVRGRTYDFGLRNSHSTPPLHRLKYTSNLPLPRLFLLEKGNSLGQDRDLLPHDRWLFHFDSHPSRRDSHSGQYDPPSVRVPIRANAPHDRSYQRLHNDCLLDLRSKNRRWHIYMVSDALFYFRLALSQRW